MTPSGEGHDGADSPVVELEECGQLLSSERTVALWVVLVLNDVPDQIQIIEDLHRQGSRTPEERQPSTESAIYELFHDAPFKRAGRTGQQAGRLDCDVSRAGDRAASGRRRVL